MKDITERFVCHDLNHKSFFTLSIAFPSVFLCSMLPFVQRFYSNASICAQNRSI